MKFDLARAPGQNLVTGYGTGYVVINGERHENHLLVTAERVEAWNVAGFESLAIEHVERFMDAARRTVDSNPRTGPWEQADADESRRVRTERAWAAAEGGRQ